jgi:Na+-translocating ferredoxin:NAD+ oxidoreductase subunit C
MNGIRLEDKKITTLITWTVKRLNPAAKVTIPIFDASACVELGQHVRIGEKIAEPENSKAVAAHASVSGEVTGIREQLIPTGGITQAIEIISDGLDEKCPEIGIERLNLENLTRNDLLALFQDSGLVDLDQEMEAVHLKAAASKQTLILNGCESEPYVTSEHALMMSHPLEILKGAEFLRQALDAEDIIIVVENNKLEVAETLKSKIFFQKWNHVQVEVMPSLYPHGTNSLLPRRLKQLKSESFAIFNIATAFAVYEAVALQKPLYERVVTVAGECLFEPKNIWARIGTEFSAAIKSCKGFLREPRKVLMNGPMKGIAQSTLEVPILKGTQAILSLPHEITKPVEVEACIRCGKCIDACPSNISPVMITLSAEQDFFDTAKEYGLEQCIECGNCSYACPSKRPMLELIRYAMSQSFPERRKVLNPIASPENIHAELFS